MAAFQSTTIKDINLAKLKQHFSDHNIKPSALSKEMGYDQSYLSGVLNGRNHMSLPAYKLMCRMLKVDEDEFIIKATDPAPKSGFKITQAERYLNDITVAIGDQSKRIDAQTQAIKDCTDAIVKLTAMLETRLKAIQYPIDKYKDDFHAFSVAMGTPETVTLLGKQVVMSTKAAEASSKAGSKQ